MPFETVIGQILTLQSYVHMFNSVVLSIQGHQTSGCYPPPSHILLVADPQILDHRSYPERGPYLTYLTRIIVDLNLRKNWRAALRKKPDAVVFLGDMMDGGRFAMSSAECVPFIVYADELAPTLLHPPE